MASRSFWPSQFPKGLRVLVVDDDDDDDSEFIKNLSKCKYKVIQVKLVQEALDVIENVEDGFDIVICDANLAEKDGFMFIEQVDRLKKDLPVILMSEQVEKTRVMKWIQNGACDCLFKPVTMKELQIIWQHVVRRKLNDFKSVEAEENPTGIADAADEDSVVADDGDGGEVDGTKKKKARMTWTNELQRSFLDAVSAVGLKNATPKKILKAMKEPTLTTTHVSSHLQKHRIALLRKKKEGDLKAANGGLNLLDSTHTFLESGVNPKPLMLQQDLVIKETSIAPRHEQRRDSSICGGNVGGIVSMPRWTRVPMQVVVGDPSDHYISYNQQLVKPKLAVNSQSNIHTFYHCRSGVPNSQCQQHIQSNTPFPRHSHNAASSRMEADYTNNRRTRDFFPIQHQNLLQHSQMAQQNPNNMIPQTGTGAAADDNYQQNSHLAAVESLDCINQGLPNANDPQNFENKYGSNQ